MLPILFMFLCSFFSFEHVRGIKIYNMSELCDKRIELSSERSYAGVLTLASDFPTGSDCEVAIRTSENYPLLIFYFTSINIDCVDTLVEVIHESGEVEGQIARNFTDDRQILCGSLAEQGIFTSRGKQVVFHVRGKNGHIPQSFNVIFSSFHMGGCETYEYQCDNGRCIDDAINCNGYNPCGDSSDCHLSSHEVAGIFVPCALVLVLLIMVLGLLIQRHRVKRRKKKNLSQLTVLRLSSLLANQDSLRGASSPPTPAPYGHFVTPSRDSSFI
ncbi:hypothetical protein ACJMK2_009168 [Sinanodonta woodiana]|uniref:CUB domain-containing protein n=1 Tax=Sinanodonta woodiana TaxID=1069815 RepID=A0ABD3VBF4_SINWO